MDLATRAAAAALLQSVLVERRERRVADLVACEDVIEQRLEVPAFLRRHDEQLPLLIAQRDRLRAQIEAGFARPLVWCSVELTCTALGSRVVGVVGDA